MAKVFEIYGKGKIYDEDLVGLRLELLLVATRYKHLRFATRRFFLDRVEVVVDGNDVSHFYYNLARRLGRKSSILPGKRYSLTDLEDYNGLVKGWEFSRMLS